MSDNSQNKDEFFDEIHQLGKNIRGFLSTAWNSQERHELEQTIKTNLEEVGDTLNQAANDFLSSENGQQIKKDIDDLKQRAETGELQQQIRKDVHDALTMISTHLETAASHFTSSPSDSPEKPSSPESD
jgi:hypothetical protein